MRERELEVAEELGPPLRLPLPPEAELPLHVAQPRLLDPSRQRRGIRGCLLERRLDDGRLHLEGEVVREAVGEKEQLLVRPIMTPEIFLSRSTELRRVVLEVVIPVVLEEGVGDELALADVGAEHRQGDARAPVLEVGRKWRLG